MKQRIQDVLLLLAITLIYSCGDINSIHSEQTEEISGEDIFYTNSIWDYWKSGEYDSAIIYSEKLVNIHPVKFSNYIFEQVVVDGITADDTTASILLTKMYGYNDERINNIIKPAILWNLIRTTQAQDSILVFFDELLEFQNDNFLSLSKAELYLLKVIMNIDPGSIIENYDPNLICTSLIKQLEDSLEHYNHAYDLHSSEKRAYLRVLLSHACYYLSESGKDENFLRLASNYSPDEIDRRFIGLYFYPSAFLSGEYWKFGFQEEYLDHLIQNNKQKQALEVLSTIAINEPDSSNIERLKKQYTKVTSDDSFQQYWNGIFSLNSPELPEFSFQNISGERGTSSQHRGKWLFIEIWGTWCTPCVEELPEIEKFYQIMPEKFNDQLVFMSISHKSKNLRNFIDQNNYTFPVVETEDSIVDLLVPFGFPTKILVSPDGHYRVIPFNSDWREFMSNYIYLRE